MKRRAFVKNTATVTALPMLFGGLPLAAFGKSTAHETGVPRKILVLIELDGGNDGLNTVIPLDQYTNLMNARKNILIPDNKVLPLHDTAVTGLHPSMGGLQDLYNNGMVSIIQGVGYPDFNYSHFRASDIWLSGSDANTVITSGWLGRYLNQLYPDYPTGYPNNQVPYPLAVRIGSIMSMVLQGPATSMGIAINSDSELYHMAERLSNNSPDTPAGYEQAFIKQTMRITEQYTEVIKEAANRQPTLSKKYPEPYQNPLAQQLKIVAQLIGGGMQTQVYVVTQYGYDTHNAQCDKSDPTKGQHANFLQQLSEAIVAFEDDLHLMGVQDNVLGVTFSEFGRRIMSNASYGTDHGSSKPVILFGSKVKGGLIGNNPIIPAVVGVNDNLPMQYDYRSVFSSVLKGWFNAPDTVLNSSMLAGYPTLDLFKG